MLPVTCTRLVATALRNDPLSSTLPLLAVSRPPPAVSEPPLSLANGPCVIVNVLPPERFRTVPLTPRSRLVAVKSSTDPAVNNPPVTLTSVGLERVTVALEASNAFPTVRFAPPATVMNGSDEPVTVRWAPLLTSIMLPVTFTRLVATALRNDPLSSTLPLLAVSRPPPAVSEPPLKSRTDPAVTVESPVRLSTPPVAEAMVLAVALISGPDVVSAAPRVKATRAPVVVTTAWETAMSGSAPVFVTALLSRRKRLAIEAGLPTCSAPFVTLTSDPERFTAAPDGDASLPSRTKSPTTLAFVLVS